MDKLRSKKDEVEFVYRYNWSLEWIIAVLEIGGYCDGFCSWISQAVSSRFMAYLAP